MQLHAAPPDVSPADRLGVTLFFAVLAHLIVLLGVTFVPEERHNPLATPLDVVLVPHPSDTEPDRADYWAQANAHGGGADAELGRPETPAPSPHSPGAQGDARPAAIPLPVPAPGRSAASADPADSTLRTDTSIATGRSREIAALSAAIDRKLRTYAERPRRKWITAQTREHAFAAYMDAWRRKVEHVGNRNYPKEATRRGLSGSLLLEVALLPDGTVESITLRRSSGHPVLDDAAVRIVRLAAPFAKFPQGVAQEVDILHIERTWRFHSGDRFSSG